MTLGITNFKLVVTKVNWFGALEDQYLMVTNRT